MFDKAFILSGKIDRDFSRSLHKMFCLRQVADYKELVEVSSEDAEFALKQAADFVKEIN
jgi:uncharacterized protein (UPF0332 family)